MNNGYVVRPITFLFHLGCTEERFKCCQSRVRLWTSRGKVEAKTHPTLNPKLIIPVQVMVRECLIQVMFSESDLNLFIDKWSAGITVG
jgi:hypothetical protein